MYILGIDLGTTNCKAGLYTTDGKAVAAASAPTPTETHAEGFAIHDPEKLWTSVAGLIRETIAKAPPGRVQCIGITSMAETGLLVDRATGKARSWFMPWFDTCSAPQAEMINEQSDRRERFAATGLHNSFKLGLAKILWLRERDPSLLDKAVWLTAAGYIAYRLGGGMATDYTLAARTYAFRIDKKTWDREWIRHFGLSEDLFPEALPAGTPIGKVTAEAAAVTGLESGIPVAIGGHDHVCAALAVGAIEPGIVYDSMGTAETLVGTMEERVLGEEEFAAGMSFGCHVAPGRMFWMGGNASSGGSVEWLRKQLSDPPLPYEQLLQMLSEMSPEPTGILFYPYLSGSGAPKPNPKARAAFVGLTKEHGRKELLKAVLEGTAYQLESIRRAAERFSGHPIHTLRVVGGGRRIPQWLQVKADITGCSLELPPVDEATMLGAALIAGVGSGIYGKIEETAALVSARSESEWVRPDADRQAQYRILYEQGYMSLQYALRSLYLQL